MRRKNKRYSCPTCRRITTASKRSDGYYYCKRCGNKLTGTRSYVVGGRGTIPPAKTPKKTSTT